MLENPRQKELNLELLVSFRWEDLETITHYHSQVNCVGYAGIALETITSRVDC